MRVLLTTAFAMTTALDTRWDAATALREYDGCSDLGTSIPVDSCAVRDAPSTLKTVNVFRLETIPKVLEDIHALTRRAYDCKVAAVHPSCGSTAVSLAKRSARVRT